MASVANDNSVESLKMGSLKISSSSATISSTRVNTNIGSPTLEKSVESANADSAKNINLHDVDRKLSVSVESQTSKNSVTYIAGAFSDVVLSYGSKASSTFNGVNIFNQSVISVPMETRSNAGISAAAISNRSSSASIITTVDSLVYFKKNLVDHYSSFRGTVFHVSSSLVKGAESEVDRILEFSSLGSVVLSSSNPKESQDMAILAHLIAKALQIPVFHLFKDSTDCSVISDSQVASYDKLSLIYKSVMNASGLSTLKTCDSISEIFNLFNLAFSTVYELVSTNKVSNPEYAVISFGNSVLSSDIPVYNTIVSQGNVLVVSINAFGLWSGAEINSLLGKSVKKALVLGYNSSSSYSKLYLDLLASFYTSNLDSNVDFVYENLYNSDGQTLESVIFEFLQIQAPVSDESENQVEDVQTAVPGFSEPQAPSSQAINLFDLQKQLIFNDSFNSSVSESPEYQDVFNISVSRIVRLTPPSYDRNLFHIEFNVGNSGLTYNIGEALGVYAENDHQNTLDLLNWYGVDPEQLFSKSVGGKSVTNTAYQWLKKKIDVFGRPGKKFYEFLANNSSDEKEATKLNFLISSEGKDEFRSRVENTITYADLLREFTSAHPSFGALIDNIPLIKSRHYSISSSSNMHPNEVHLLVVTVNWETTYGTRFGLASNYLEALKVGDHVKVSVIHSALKLPEDNLAPVIMAGLGTGMAPFRAFIEERAFRRANGIEVGPMALYFGSRHRTMEYLYGEDLESYHADGLLTRLQLAFSRDQPEKIYIQHKLNEDSDTLNDWLLNSNGSFYLCGPTWPVPDVREAIVSSFVKKSNVSTSAANKALEELREEERYVLEVY
ncbi:putative sulfite reductase [NADPH] flavoprotein component [Smittium mucronatum]|uniref:assimilatory sulfite reductase (NADPH) n=1 Tax=Smittium mucronatum TaxID=133383 RepID=A0A1R0GNG9_9FUNG|nr:putative sulfite reductase [NADPH] flavoprotein component [Smittium mucronatum]